MPENHVTEGQFIEYIQEAATQMNKIDDKINQVEKITGFNQKGNVATYADLATIENPQVNDAYGVIADGLTYVYNGNSFPTEGNGMDLRIKPDGVIEEGNTQAVSGGEVYKKTAVYDQVIYIDYEEISSQVLAGTTVLINSSTFAGWGENKGVIKDFNRVSYIFEAYSAENLPTEVRLIIRKGSDSGEILYNILKNIELQHLELKEISFDLPEIFENENNDDVFIQFTSNGYISLIGTAGGSPIGSVKYTTVKGSEIVETPVTNANTMYVKLIKTNSYASIRDQIIERIKSKIYKSYPNPQVLLTSKVWLFPGLQYNIFNKNVCVPDFGDNLINYRLDFNGNVGTQFNRGYRYTIGASINQNITLDLMKGREILTTKTQNLISSDANNGNGVTRNVLLIGDSTVDGSNISTPLKAVFDADVMNINLIGTLGATGVKHEGRGGWKIEDYYGYGRTLYQINVSGITTPPSVGARYTQGASIYNVEEINITGGVGYFSVTLASGSAPTTSGTLTKTSGSGDASIVYSSMSQTSANPFYNPSTTKFDIGYYLTHTGQTLGSGDWIGFQLGINDVFNITDITGAVTTVNAMISQMNEMIANIHSYNANIRIALCVTFPPADQDAFGSNYNTGQLSELYAKTGLVTWQQRLLTEFDNETKINQRIYLVSAHLNLDTEYNYPTSEVAVNSRNTTLVKMQNNGVHPSTTGYAQIADMYAGIIKYFG